MLLEAKRYSHEKMKLFDKTSISNRLRCIARKYCCHGNMLMQLRGKGGSEICRKVFRCLRKKLKKFLCQGENCRKAEKSNLFYYQKIGLENKIKVNSAPKNRSITRAD